MEPRPSDFSQFEVIAARFGEARSSAGEDFHPTAALRSRIMTAKGLKCGLTRERLFNSIRGVTAGYRDSLRLRLLRLPVGRSVYWLHRQLRKQQAVPLDLIEPRLPPLAEVLAQ